MQMLKRRNCSYTLDNIVDKIFQHVLQMSANLITVLEPGSCVLFPPT
jgi:hypothetical protein